MSYQRRTLEGRPHLVVPVVLLVEGVLNGSHGSIYYPISEIRNSARAWNGKPLVVFHPDFNGGIAGAPEVFDRQRVGWVFNVSVSGSKLVGEAWIDEERAGVVDVRVVASIFANRMLEVSTGLSLEQTTSSGEFGGRPYDYIGTDFDPDHLAILPDQIGACSIEMGCGLVRNELVE